MKRNFSIISNQFDFITIFVTLLFHYFPPISLYEGQSLILAVLSTLRPPYSPDLNPIDYLICGVLGEDTNKKFQTNIKALEHAISAGYDILDRKAVAHTCMSLTGFLEAVNNESVSFIE